MRPRNQPAREALQTALARRSPVSAPELAAAVGVSVPTLHRMLPELGASVVVAGKARRTRYGLRRPLRGESADLPLYEIDASGRAEHVADLALLRPEGSFMNLGASRWPVPEESIDGWWDGLPYPLYDMRPQGYMGRQFARAESRHLAVSPDPTEWGDDDIAHVLARSGSDVSGNLVLGNAAYERWQQGKLAAEAPLRPRSVAAAYLRFAEQAVASGVAGSSAGGEFPKFAAQREARGADTPHVLVKFSGADRSPTVQRWSDLLVCEHLALDCIATLPDLRSARSRIVQGGGRTFLEVERFDRHGAFGRSGLASLETINAAFIGEGSTDWTRLGHRLHAAKLLSSEDVARIELLWWFGRLIANTDMHLGNLSFRPRREATPQAERSGPAAPAGPAVAGFDLSPAYDMPPMLYAPLAGGEVPARTFEPPLPLPPQRAAWTTACEAALLFWQRAAGDARIDEAFRKICAVNAQRLETVAAHA
jgi:hypothetical protein